MNDKQRVEFEKWAKAGNFQLDVDKYGSYKSVCTWAAWKAWQAAISSVVIELPQVDVIQMTPNPDVMSYYCYQVDEVKSALTEAGIRYG